MDTSFETARFNMIHQQVRPWDVTDDRVIGVMSDIPREHFVPDAYRGLAYADIEIPIGDGQRMMAPVVVGRMLQALSVAAEDRVLEIGTGTGYVTACLARLGSRIVSLEIDPELARQARENLETLGYRGLDLRAADGLAIPYEGGPFEAVAVTGSLPDDEALPGLQGQLAPGGRLFVVIGEGSAMEAVLVTRTSAAGFTRKTLFETSVTALANTPEPERFIF
jgi:protein-L-isoaspartate(D-aspartate) O-methyltransferase